MATKVTYSVDDETVERIDRLARRLGLSRSRVVREAVAEYAARVGRLTAAERDRLLQVMDEVMQGSVTGSAAAVDREIAVIRAARRAGGRASPA